MGRYCWDLVAISFFMNVFLIYLQRLDITHVMHFSFFGLFIRYFSQRWEMVLVGLSMVLPQRMLVFRIELMELVLVICDSA